MKTNDILKQTKNLFKKQGVDIRKQFLISLDIDKTIVDRDISSHSIFPPLANIITKFNNLNNIYIYANTGRDLTAMEPILKQIRNFNNLILMNGSQTIEGESHRIDKRALFPVIIKKRIWDLFIKGEFPFLDIKSDRGTYFIVKPNSSVKHLLATQKPKDWYGDNFPRIIEVKGSKYSYADFFDKNILRFEIPIVQKDLVRNINNENQLKLQKPFQRDMFGKASQYEINVIPSRVKRDSLKKKIGFLRISMNGTHINKASALKEIAKRKGIKESNIIHIGDSSKDKSVDSNIKDVLPRSTLLILNNGDNDATSKADYILNSVKEHGAYTFLKSLIPLISNS